LGLPVGVVRAKITTRLEKVEKWIDLWILLKAI
jgi:hypothetical protein